MNYIYNYRERDISMDENMQEIQHNGEVSEETTVLTGQVEGQPQPNVPYVNSGMPQYMHGGMSPEPPGTKSGICIAALVLGIVAFFINPLYLVSITGLVMGIVGINQKPIPLNKSLGIWGIVLSSTALVIQLILDIILAAFTGGMSFCC